MKKYETCLISGVNLSYKILSFDQSTSKTGWAFFDGQELIDYGVINKSKVKDTPERIRSMFLDITQKIQDINPDKVIVEEVQQQASPATSMMLSQLEGMIIGYAYEHNIPVESAKPVCWRKSLGFQQGKNVKRSELKEQAKIYVKNAYGIDTDSDDMADAICIGTSMTI